MRPICWMGLFQCVFFSCVSLLSHLFRIRFAHTGALWFYGRFNFSLTCFTCWENLLILFFILFCLTHWHRLKQTYNINKCFSIRQSNTRIHVSNNEKKRREEKKNTQTHTHTSRYIRIPQTNSNTIEIFSYKRQQFIYYANEWKMISTRAHRYRANTHIILIILPALNKMKLF